MYGWVKTGPDNIVEYVSVKKPVSTDPYNDPAIVGAFYFRKAAFFKEALRRLQEKDIRVNNEFYIDSCVNEILGMGLRARAFELDHYVCWGTPEDVKVCAYWKDFFEKHT
jgi:hypothetical protein